MLERTVDSGHTGPGPRTVAVIDYGGQYAHLIARRVRSLGLFSRIYQPEDFSADNDAVGIILSGGPDSVTRTGSPGLPFELSKLSVPVLGLCYGHQLLAASVGGTIASDGKREYGIAKVQVEAQTHLFLGLEQHQRVWMSHGDHVDALPAGFSVTASSPAVEIAGFESDDGRIFGLQFHPEVTHTDDGMSILDNFLSVCSPLRDWNPDGLEQKLCEEVRREAKGRKLFLLVSGGVDSLVSLVLCIRAVGPEQVISLHIDTGFMRKEESASVMAHLRSMGFDNLHIADASDRFFDQLQGLVEPEAKRKVIGRLFVEALDDKIADLRLGDDWMLVQGTIYPDTIESGGTRNAATIKTHHNRVEEIEKMLAAGRVIEPLSELYKDEVRVLGQSLGLPEHLVQRHPFPGPGLAIRILGHEGDDEGGTLEGQGLVPALASRFGLNARILPVKSVGVQGDLRTYQHPVAMWPKAGKQWAWDWDLMQAAATSVVNQAKSVNRAVFSPDNLDRKIFRLAPLALTRDSVLLLQEVDAVVFEMLAGFDELWQVPVVSLPLLDETGRRVFVIRPVCSRDAMTADVFRMDSKLFDEICARVAKIDGAGRLLYDLTAKPPGTIEWE